MESFKVKRLVWVTLAAALVVGVWANVGGAVRTPKAEPKFSASDCETIQNIEVEDASGGYWGETAVNASTAFKGAAKDIENKELRNAMKTLASVWRTVGKADSVIAAAKITTKAKKYGKALGTYTKAQITCSTQDLNEAFDNATTTTEPLADDSSSSSTDDGSSSSSSD
jgi:hypothetical protein